MMTFPQQIVTIAMCALGSIITRFLPFLIFRPDKPTPKFVKYLGDILPGAIFAMLIVYCLKNVSFTTFSYGLPEILAILATALFHLWKRNMLISISAGTIFYMILIQFVF